MVNDNQVALSIRLRRCVKHACYMPWRSRQLFNASSVQRITDKVHLAEQGHRGEIKVVIEGALSLLQAYSLTNRKRAEQLFGYLGVWDTEYNSGVLLYLNLCDHTIDIVADRGISAFVPAATWQAICADIASGIRSNGFEAGLNVGISQIGAILTQFYACAGEDKANELSNKPIVLR